MRLLILPAVLVGFMAVASSAAAFPLWDVQTRWGDQNLKPGGHGEFVVTLRNNGFEATDGSPITVTLELPPGVTRVAPLPADPDLQEGWGWTCEGTSTVTCTSTDIVSSVMSGKVAQSGAANYIFIRVAIDPGASGTGTVTTSASGGAPFSIPGSDADQVTFSSERAGFGAVPGSFRADAYNGSNRFSTPVRQAGSHPFELRVDFEMNLRHEERPPLGPGRSPESLTTPEEHIRTVEVTLPRGLIGNPEAVPKCQPKDFLNSGLVPYTSCPPDTQVGYMDLQLSNGTEMHGFSFFGINPGLWTKVAVYNLEPPKGVPADFGFHVALAEGHIYPRLDPAQGYSIKAEVPYTSDLAPVRHAKFTMWGVPGDPAHDEFRYKTTPKAVGDLGASFNSPIKPLLTLGMDCAASKRFQWRADSWSRPGVFTPTLESESDMEVTGCDDLRIRFQPDVSLTPSSTAASGPTGLQVNLKVPQRDQTVTEVSKLYNSSGDIHAIDTPPMKKAVVTFPEGMTISTSAAQGLESCSAAQIGLGDDSPVRCPQASQYGTLTLRTPILPKDAPMTGKIYVAKQNDNPFKNFLSLYLVVEEEDRGLRVKIPGRVDLDPVTGQITTTFDDLPQFPVSDMELNLKGGNRAGLVNPSTCGEKTIKAEFYSWADPTTPITRSSSYRVTSKADGSPCVADLAGRPFAPAAQGGTVNPSAGAYSPFVYRVQRSDDDQELSALRVDLPKGLLARIAGVAKCSEAAIAAAQAPGRTGTEEANSPSCPAASLVGSTEAGSGVGQVLTYVPGKLYLAGPYKGAPLSMVAITPVLAGPYDLGVIAVRTKLEVDPTTAQAAAVSDPLPQIFKGIPVRIRDLRINVDREQTTLNPTSCDPTSVASLLTGTGGLLGTTADDTQASVANRFQAANCASLAFKPRLRLKMKGGTKRSGHPAVHATLTFPRGASANIKNAEVLLPPTQLIDNANVNNPCTRDQFAAEACPASSILGTARAYTPLLDQPLEGNVYFRANGGARTLPDLVADLRGDIRVVLVGWIDSVGPKGSEVRRIRTRFRDVPDAPVTKFEMRLKGGKKGLIVNNTNICRSKAPAIVKMDAQNGKVHDFKPKVGKRCGGGPASKGR